MGTSAASSTPSGEPIPLALCHPFKTLDRGATLRPLSLAFRQRGVDSQGVKQWCISGVCKDCWPPSPWTINVSCVINTIGRTEPFGSMPFLSRPWTGVQLSGSPRWLFDSAAGNLSNIGEERVRDTGPADMQCDSLLNCLRSEGGGVQMEAVSVNVRQCGPCAIV